MPGADARWQMQQEPGCIPTYWRVLSGGYHLRRVFEHSGAKRMDKRWALYKNRHRVWELQAMSSLTAAMEQAEEWLKEHEIVR